MKNDMFYSDSEEPPERSSTIVDFKAVTPAAVPLPPLRSCIPSRKSARSQRGGPRLTISARANAFRKRHYPGVSASEWNDWRWQNRNRVRSADDLARIVNLSDDERDAIARHKGPLPVGIPPYYASLLDDNDPNQPLRRTVVPVGGEYMRAPGEADDPLGEDGDSPVPGLVHRYPDRVLFLVTNFCSTYCRYCTRSRLVGAAGERSLKKSDIDRAIDYIAATPVIRDVLISGGDPLSLDDDRLDFILGRLRAIPHVEFLRIGTKQPAVMPQRVTPALVRILKKYHPLWMSLHFTHPDELTPEVAEACNRLADAGIPLGSQTVLLKGVNDDVPIMKQLVHGLLKLRVKPYYLYQCDPISGSAHFRTTVDKGLEIIRGLRGHTTGYAVPSYVVDGPGGGGKIPLLPDYVLGRDGDDLLLTNYAGKVYRYPDPHGSLGRDKHPRRRVRRLKAPSCA
ncbi:MAG: KamA family radical SAM protein [Gammaproteobacteria bacterium]